MSAKKAVIFDFDGTIANTLPLAIGILNKLSLAFGYEKIHEEQVAELRNMTINDMRRYLKLSWLELPLFLLSLKKELFNQFALLRPVFGMSDVLAELRHKGLVLGVITSNDDDVVQKFLHTYFPEYFVFTKCGTSLFGKHKVLTQMSEVHGWKTSEIVYVGDEVRDIEAAQRAGIEIISVTWGFQSEDLLQKYKPDYLIHQPKELLGLV